MAAINNCAIFWWCAHCCWLWWWWWSFWFGYQLIYKRRQSFCDATMRKWISVSAKYFEFGFGWIYTKLTNIFLSNKTSLRLYWYAVFLYALFHIHNSEGWTFKLNGLNVKTSRTNEIESYKRQHTDCNENNNNKKKNYIIVTNTNKIDQIFILFSIFYWAIKWKMF